ncbi:hypothetical protein EmuJ_000522000 [Echinococcus multilocularis]|uniref:Uncharacterized protein n=1 Tax=Echinococcus multilocularis TaxID=6211 RepID=A0A068Y462_ECHMU|nr:hypothetical protein EmuJ_000522000 [Echinococcus multilocularis]
MHCRTRPVGNDNVKLYQRPTNIRLARALEAGHIEDSHHSGR